MRLAAAAGVETAEVALRPVAAVDGLPKDWLAHGGQVLVVRRFDRGPAGRTHIEDFAQILGAVGDQKYTRANVDTMLRMVSRFCADPTAAVLQAVRRVVVDILLGNNDAHLKNWPLIYRDPRAPALAPAHDIVPTWLYDRDPGMALKFGGTRSAPLIDGAKFRRAATWLDMDPRALERAARETVEAAAAAWPAQLSELPIGKGEVAALRARWATLALASGVANGFAAVHPPAARRARRARAKTSKKAR